MSDYTRWGPSLIGLRSVRRCRRVSAPRGSDCTTGAKVMVQAMLMLAGGRKACSDIERLRPQPTLFGAVPSDSTLYRSVRSIDAITLAGLWLAQVPAGRTTNRW